MTQPSDEAAQAEPADDRAPPPQPDEGKAPSASGPGAGAPAGSEPGAGAPAGSEPGAEEEPAAEIGWWRILKRIAAVVVTGAVLYALAPTLAQVFSTWPRLSTLDLVWLLPAAACEGGSFVCTFGLKRIALHTRAWFAVTTSALVGNAVTNVFPGADATGAAMELHLLTDAGVGTANAVGGLTATSYLQTGSLLALPLLALPAVLAGAPISRSLVDIAYLGLGLSVLYGLAGYVLFVRDGPLRWIGRLVETAHNRLLQHRAPVTGLGARLLRQRDATRSALGRHWKEAVGFVAGRVGLDFFCLFGAIAATRVNARPAVVLIAYAATTVLALIPITPGGLGIVEASLTGLLTLAGLPAAEAALATLAYRLFSYWGPTLSGPFAYLAYRLRFREPSPREPAPKVSPAEHDVEGP